ncbi:hypothetical protein N311_11162, partial [Apaloderma vittatum]
VNTHPHRPRRLLHPLSPFRPPHNPSPGQPARHVLAAAWVAFHHLVGELEASVGDLWH